MKNRDQGIYKEREGHWLELLLIFFSRTWRREYCYEVANPNHKYCPPGQIALLYQEQLELKYITKNKQATSRWVRWCTMASCIAQVPDAPFVLCHIVIHHYYRVTSQNSPYYNHSKNTFHSMIPSADTMSDAPFMKSLFPQISIIS